MNQESSSPLSVVSMEETIIQVYEKQPKSVREFLKSTGLYLVYWSANLSEISGDTPRKEYAMLYEQDGVLFLVTERARFNLEANSGVIDYMVKVRLP